MLYVKNVPVWERLLRAIVAMALAAYAVLNFGGAMSWLLLASAASLVLTGVFGFCPACAMVGRRLDKR